MERRDRPPVTRFVVENRLVAGSSIELPDAAAHHARVKRMSAGDVVSLTDGCGHEASGVIERIAKREVAVAVGGIEVVPPATPLELFVPVGDRDRMLWLAEKATELGVTAWRPVMCARSRSVSPRGEGEAFGAKVRARMIGALEQSGGAWLPEVHPVVEVGDAACDARMPARYLLQAGAPRVDATHAASGAAVI
nr:RsmE family RNA methyltransferase [Gemmatimonadaceae bacterium]